MRAFIVLGLLFLSIPNQETGSEKRLRDVPLCVEWDVKPQLNQSVNQPTHIIRAFVVLGLLLFPYQAKRLAWGNVSEMTYFCVKWDRHVKLTCRATQANGYTALTYLLYCRFMSQVYDVQSCRLLQRLTVPRFSAMNGNAVKQSLLL